MAQNFKAQQMGGMWVGKSLNKDERVGKISNTTKINYNVKPSFNLLIQGDRSV